MIVFDLSNLYIKNKDGDVLGKIDPNKKNINNDSAFNDLYLCNEKKIISTFKNWFFLGFFHTQHNIINQLLTYVTEDNILKL